MKKFLCLALILGFCYASSYESRSGNRYQYDLSNPIDKMRYEMDLGAQTRDQMLHNQPKIQQDRDWHNQYGGGIR